ncbi:hypothetical protein ACH47C_01670 [Streptomyces rishiriensis]|uniref:hypothetical protein n=1 Tax=Streptomyces rishiriensis TaxID=68264 RepID=UPI0033CCA481
MDAVQLAQEVTPYIATAVTAYGTAVLTRFEGVATDATVSFGQRLLQRLIRREDAAAELTDEQSAVIDAVSDLAKNSDDEDFLVALRLQIRRLLAAHPDLTEDISGMMQSSPASGDHIQFHGPIFGPVQGKGEQRNYFNKGIL